MDVAEGHDGEVGDVLLGWSPEAIVGDDREVLRVEDAANSDGIANSSEGRSRRDPPW